jgi:hypothetical protein
MVAQVITATTIHLALLCLAGRYWSDLQPTLIAWEKKRAIWSLGCVAFLCHVWSAFHFHHQWSHASAFQVTAERTYEMLGFRFGEGIYFSYLFMCLWMFDVAWMWLAPLAYMRGVGLYAWIVLGFMLFIAFNGAIVFEAGVTRWLGLPICLAGGWLAWRKIRFSSATQTKEVPQA